MLTGKIHRATVTDADLDYVGSLTVDTDLLDAAKVLANQQVDVVDVTNGSRLTTYVIPGERGSGTVCVNGAAAHHIHPGDVVIVIAYGMLDSSEVRRRLPRVVFVDADHRIVEQGPDAGHAPAGFGVQPSGVRVSS